MTLTTASEEMAAEKIELKTFNLIANYNDI